jgi:hypothetical protein
VASPSELMLDASVPDHLHYHVARVLDPVDDQEGRLDAVLDP